MPRPHKEQHRTQHVGWLRAAVLGANDGVISTASLVVGVAVAGAGAPSILLTGVAGMVAGAMSMAAGEYVSVQSQADAEDADLAIEREELATEPERELVELTGIYVRRGLDPALARQVAERLTATNALETHARDELGITETFRARPAQAALASAGSFAAGALVPIATVMLCPAGWAAPVAALTALVTLFILGGIAAHVGGAPIFRAAVRVGFWGALAMSATAIVGRLFGTAV